MLLLPLNLFIFGWIDSISTNNFYVDFGIRGLVPIDNYPVYTGSKYYICTGRICKWNYCMKMQFRRQISYFHVS